MVNSPTLYSYEEIQEYLKTPPVKEADKLRAMKELANFTRDEIDKMIKDRLIYLMSKVRVLDTHFVSGAGGGERTHSAPLKILYRGTGNRPQFLTAYSLERFRQA
ncbi:MAG: hypothetical protein Q7U47_05365 [Paludibacter sp.]|nr:hypothetical protein [Paludibacter sp.]